MINNKYMTECISEQGIEVSLNNLPFPRKTGFTHIEAIKSYHNAMTVKAVTEYTTEEILTLVAETGHLGNSNIDYILKNLAEYMYIFRSSPSMERHLMHSKALTKLISVNIFRQEVRLTYDLPPILSRKFVNIKEDLLHYMRDNKVNTLVTLG